VQKTFLGRVPEPLKYDSEDKDCISEIERIADEVGCLLSENELDKALKRILKFATYFNQYFQRKQPWSNKTTASTTLFIAVNGVRSIAIILEPFIPSSCEKIWSQLGMSGSIHEQQWKSASQMKIAAGHILGNVQPLFRSIESKEIEQQKTKLGKQNG
jgi:methionyl-tRNA synthetase